MKKQIFFTVFVLFCTLFVFALAFSPSATTQGGTEEYAVPISGELMAVSAEPPPVPESGMTITRPSIRLYLYKGMPFALDGIRLISIVQITLMAIFISLFIKPKNPKIECVFDSDGKK